MLVFTKVAFPTLCWVDNMDRSGIATIRGVLHRVFAREIVTELETHPQEGFENFQSLFLVSGQLKGCITFFSSLAFGYSSSDKIFSFSEDDLIILLEDVIGERSSADPINDCILKSIQTIFIS